MTTTADVTVVVTVHSETLVAGPTMESAEQAIAAAEAAGHSVERILVLDNPPEATSAYFRQPAFDAWDRRRVASWRSSTVTTSSARTGSRRASRC
jgi:hypothetical protein